MRKYYTLIILCLLFVAKAKAQNQLDTIDLSGLFNEADLIIHDDSYANTFVDEGTLYVSEVLHLPQRLQNNTLNKVLVFADSTLFSSCEYRIRRFAYDIYYVYGCEIIMKVIKGETCTDVKNLILNDSTNLDGVVFIGDISPASYEADDAINDYNHTSWLCDMYFMDLDAFWNDYDHDLTFDNYIGDFHPEVFVGRICTNKVGSGSSELELFNKYMDKNHAFWIGHRHVNKEFALSYTDLSWKGSYDIVYGIRNLYGASKYDHITANNPVFCANDYLERLRNEKYEFVQLASHSSSNQHVFDSLVPNSSNSYDTLKVYINSSKIYTNGVKAIGMNLFCCSACRWISNNYLGGNYVYSPNSSVLSLVGSTKVGSMLSMSSFYTPLQSGKTMGQALVDWWKSDTYYQTSMDSTLCWFFGLTIIGDPLVNFFHCTNSTCQDQITLTSYDSNNTPLSYYLTSEKITVAPPATGSFTIPVGDHCIFNAPTVEIKGEFLCPFGSSMEILNEGCRDNCDE